MDGDDRQKRLGEPNLFRLTFTIKPIIQFKNNTNELLKQFPFLGLQYSTIAKNKSIFEGKYML